jgi:hypothetical protein
MDKFLFQVAPYYAIFFQEIGRRPSWHNHCSAMKGNDMTMMSFVRNVLLLLLSLTCLMVTGCATAPQVNVVRSQAPLESPIRTIALMPSGGVLADAIGLELLRFAFNVIDTGKISGLMIRDNLNEIEVTQPQNLSRLYNDGIDAVILVKSVAGYDGRPQSASVKIVHTKTGQLVAGANWQNGRGGVQGSAMDQDARVDLAAAAKQIANALGQSLQATPIK